MGTIQFFKLKLNKKKQHVIISVINFGRFLASNHCYLSRLCAQSTEPTFSGIVLLSIS